MIEVYLDYNGSSPLDPRVGKAMWPALAEWHGNASSTHRFGRRQAAAVEDARARVASLVGGRPTHVIFTAGATEANNLALSGIVASRSADRGPNSCLLSGTRLSPGDGSVVERSVTCRSRCDSVTSGGAVDLDALEALLGNDVLFVSVMAANSETGVLNPVVEIAERTHAAGALFHCDATQYAGRLPFDLSDIGADLVSLSSHKICGPGGVGALVAAKSSGRLRPIIHGGGHEKALRSGSLNVAGIVGFGAAAEIAAEERVQEADRIRPLRDRLVAELKRGLSGSRKTGILTIGFPTRRTSASRGPTPRQSSPTWTRWRSRPAVRVVPVRLNPQRCC